MLRELDKVWEGKELGICALRENCVKVLDIDWQGKGRDWGT